jgi:hypothetical protein
VSVAPTPRPEPAVAAVSAWLLVEAFSGGCAAMTGVEAVSNGVQAFRDPKVKNAHATLTIIIATLILLLAVPAPDNGKRSAGANSVKADRRSPLSRARALTEFVQPAPKSLRHSGTGNERSTTSTNLVVRNSGSNL